MDKSTIFLLILISQTLFSEDHEAELAQSKTFIIGHSPATLGAFTYGYSQMKLAFAEGMPFVMGKFGQVADDILIFLGGNHRTDWVSTFPFGSVFHEQFGDQEIPEHEMSKGGVFIGNDVWIASHAVIMSGVTIGDGAVIGAFSVVTKDVEPYAIVAGNPARFIRYRFGQEIRELLLQLRWWDLDVEQIKELAPELCQTPDVDKLRFWLKKYRNL
jgi:acetyltransferase-like isoleucine patch superfamily enzyme